MDPVAQLILTYRYVVLVPLALAEGPVLSFTCGILIAAGYLDPFVTFAVLLFADLVRDGFYYGLGRFGRDNSRIRHYAARIGIGDEQLGILRLLWLEHSIKTMVLSKLAYALTPPLLVTAGLAGTPLRRFLGLALLVTTGQYGLLMVIGYEFGSTVGVVTDILLFVQIAVAAAVLVAVGSYFIGRYARARLMAAAKQPDDPPS